MGGQRGEYYSFKNDSQSPCTLKGAPTFALLDSAGHKIPGQKVTQTDDPAETVTLQPGGKALFSIDYRSCSSRAKRDMARRCVTAAKLQIEAPEAKRAFVLKSGIDPEKLKGKGFTPREQRSYGALNIEPNRELSTICLTGGGSFTKLDPPH